MLEGGVLSADGATMLEGGVFLLPSAPWFLKVDKKAMHTKHLIQINEDMVLLPLRSSFKSLATTLL